MKNAPETSPPRIWTMVSYSGDFSTARQNTHPGYVYGTPEVALEAARILLASIGDGRWALAVGPGPNFAAGQGWGVFGIQELPPGQGWEMTDPWGQKKTWGTRSMAVRYAMQCGPAEVKCIRIWNLDGTLRKIIVGHTRDHF